MSKIGKRGEVVPIVELPVTGANQMRDVLESAASRIETNRRDTLDAWLLHDAVRDSKKFKYSVSLKLTITGGVVDNVLVSLAAKVKGATFEYQAKSKQLTLPLQPPPARSGLSMEN